jgi:acyl carrier protein
MNETDVDAVRGGWSMNEKQLELELKELIIDALMLENVAADDIDSDEPLFVDGLGLDSIDALELAMAIDKKYGVRIKADDEQNRRIFSNVKSLAEYVINIAPVTATSSTRARRSGGCRSRKRLPSARSVGPTPRRLANVHGPPLAPIARRALTSTPLHEPHGAAAMRSLLSAPPVDRARARGETRAVWRDGGAHHHGKGPRRSTDLQTLERDGTTRLKGSACFESRRRSPSSWHPARSGGCAPMCRERA